MAINDSTLSSDVWTTIRNVLVANKPKVILSSGETKTSSIYAQYNDKSHSVPQIIIMPAGISENNWKFGSSEGKKFINVNVECYYKNTSGVDQLADGVKSVVKNALADGTIVGMELIAVAEEYAFVDPNQMKFSLKTLTLTFDRE